MLPSRGFISRLGLVLIMILTRYPALAQQEHPVLRLLVFGSDQPPIRPSKPAGVDDAAVTALSTPPARRVTWAFIGRPINDALLADIRDRLTDYYVSIGRPFVSVAITGQDVSAGTLRVNVIEMKRGHLKVEGNRWFDDQQYLGAIHTQAGDPIDIQSLANDTNWIDRSDHRHVTIAVEPGDDPATYDLTIHAKDSLPLDLTLALDNTGTTDTGLYRSGLAVDWTNALWRGDDLTYGFLTSPDQFRLLENALSYTAWLPWRDSVTLSAVDADIHAKTTAASNGSSVNGRTDIVSFRYNMALASSPGLVHHIELGYDFKSTDSNVLNGGNAVFPTTSELDQFVLSYGVSRNDVLGQTGMTAALIGSSGNLTPRNTASALAAQQPDASPSYVYGRLSIDRLTNLPRGLTWSASLTAQYSSDNLLPSEQLVFGGIRSIRGFAELGAARDEGIVMQNEIRLAPVHPDFSQTWNASRPVVPFVFLDLGAGRNHLDSVVAQRSWLEMVSAGPGVSWQFTPAASVRLSWGFPLVRDGHTGPLLGPQFGIQMSF